MIILSYSVGIVLIWTSKELWVAIVCCMMIGDVVLCVMGIVSVGKLVGLAMKIEQHYVSKRNYLAKLRQEKSKIVTVLDRKKKIARNRRFNDKVDQIMRIRELGMEGIQLNEVIKIEQKVADIENEPNEPRFLVATRDNFIGQNTTDSITDDFSHTEIKREYSTTERSKYFKETEKIKTAIKSLRRFSITLTIVFTACFIAITVTTARVIISRDDHTFMPTLLFETSTYFFTLMSLLMIRYTWISPRDGWRSLFTENVGSDRATSGYSADLDTSI
eukprot:939985_1